MTRINQNDYLHGMGHLDDIDLSNLPEDDKGSSLLSIKTISQKNNPMRRKRVMAIEIVNNILCSNRKILKELLAQTEDLKIKKQDLQLRGFNFLYFTHTHTTECQQYFFCYEYVYLAISDDWYQILRPPTIP